MRTNDIINLLPYDIFHHTFLQRYIASVLGLEVGTYNHFAGHMYYPKRRELPERNFLDKFIFKMENIVQMQYEIPETLIGRDLHGSMKKQYEMAGESMPKIEDLESPLIQEMVKFIMKMPTTNKEFNCLK